MSETGRMRSGFSGADRTRMIRCPYCVEQAEFKLMNPRDGSAGRYMCDGCGHVAMPSDPEFHCPCAKCSGLISKFRLRSG